MDLLQEYRRTDDNGIETTGKYMYYQANMETIILDLTSRRRVLDANLVWRRPGALPKLSTFSPSAHFLYYQDEGERRMADREGTFPMAPGDVILFAAGHHYPSFGAANAYRAMNILFECRPGDRCLSGSPLESSPDMTATAIRSRSNVGHLPQIRQRFEEIVLLAHASSPLRRAKGEAMLGELLIDMAIVSAHDPDVETNRMAYAVELVERSLGRSLDLDDVAAQVGMSRRSLTRHFRRFTGVSVQQYQLQSRLKVARSILKTNPDITMREVADTLGFYDEFHFSRTFRRLCGTSPSAYRDTLQSRMGPPTDG